MRKKWWIFFVAPPAFVLFVALGGWIVMLLWNWLLPAIVGWRAVTFWQALGLLALCRILFGGFGRGGHRGSGVRGRIGERLERMTPEERERMRERMRERCGFGSRRAEPGAPEPGH